MPSLKERIHDLVDRLPPAELPVAERFLEFLRAAWSDPVLRALAAASLDDEPFTEEERLVVRDARAEMIRGEGVPHASARRRRGP